MTKITLCGRKTKRKEENKLDVNRINNYQITILAWAVLAQAINDYSNKHHQEEAEKFLNSREIVLWTAVLKEIDYHILQENLHKLKNKRLSRQYHRINSTPQGKEQSQW